MLLLKKKNLLFKIVINTHYIHSVLGPDFVIEKTFCVNQHHNEARKRLVSITGTGTAYRSGVSEFMSGFLWVRVARSFSVWCLVDQCLSFWPSSFDHCIVFPSSIYPPPRGCAGGKIGTRFLRPRGTSPLKGANPAGTPGYRNGTESFFGLKGRTSVVRDV